MAASVLFACGLNEQKLPPFVHISEESNTDGSFLITSILGQRLRISNSGTLLICLQHNYQHYVNAGMRLGYNTNIFLDKTLRVIDIMTDIGYDISKSKWMKDPRQLVKLLMSDVQEQLTVNFVNRVNTTIIIDNLSILLNLGATMEEVKQFCLELAKLSKEHENLTIITKISNSDAYDYVDNNVAKLSDIRITVIQLKSGVFREVDGKLLIERINDDEESLICDKITKEILYKVNERNIKIFNPGEIGVKV